MSFYTYDDPKNWLILSQRSPSTYDESTKFSGTSEVSIWNAIVEENLLKREQIEEYGKSKGPQECASPDCPEIVHLDKVFMLLQDVLEKTVFKAIENDALLFQKCKFNGLDFIAEYLWNMNPLYPERKDNWLCIYDIPWAREYLAENPRPIFPKSWLWTKEEAATVIQAAMRGYWVRRTEEVQEMRQFWKALYEDKKVQQGKLPYAGNSERQFAAEEVECDYD